MRYIFSVVFLSFLFEPKKLITHKKEDGRQRRDEEEGLRRKVQKGKGGRCKKTQQENVRRDKKKREKTNY